MIDLKKVKRLAAEAGYDISKQPGIADEPGRIVEIAVGIMLEYLNVDNTVCCADENERSKMQSIRTIAEVRAEEVTNSVWKRAYNTLADAADRIDGLITRTEVIADQE